eukprot:3813941-Rhodomonas_salina.3
MKHVRERGRTGLLGVVGLAVVAHEGHVGQKELLGAVEALLEARLDEREVDGVLDDRVVVWHILWPHWLSERPRVLEEGRKKGGGEGKEEGKGGKK